MASVMWHMFELPASACGQMCYVPWDAVVTMKALISPMPESGPGIWELSPAGCGQAVQARSLLQYKPCLCFVTFAPRLKVLLMCRSSRISSLGASWQGYGADASV